MFIFLQTAGATQANVESEPAKASEGKDRAANKRSRGASGNPGLVAAKIGESGKAASGSGNDGATQRYFYFFFSTDIIYLVSYVSCNLLCTKPWVKPLVFSQFDYSMFFICSAESGSEGSSDGTDENNNNV